MGAMAEPTVAIKRAYYTVSGNSVRELRRSMNEQKPKYVALDAFTQWNVTWTYTWRPVDGGAVIKSVKVNTTVGITLPRWTPPSHADPKLVERWQTYIKALTQHENGHANIGIQTAKDIEKQLSSLPIQPSNAALKEVVDGIGQRILTEARAKEKQFDEETQNGTKQGARFP